MLSLYQKGISQAKCGFDILHNKLLKNDSEYARTIEKNDERISKLLQSRQIKYYNRTLNESGVYVIPIVIHVMHTGGVEGTIYNPSKQQILSTIDYLNQVYNGSYPGIEGVGNIEIQFELAKRSPSSVCTDGIVRIDASSLPGYISNGINADNINGCPELTLKNLARWNTNDYYNIWIVNKIDGEDGTSANPFIAGFAHFPGASSSIDGTVLLATQMLPGLKTLPHELGHALNLYHTFQGSTSSNCPINLFCSLFGDRVCDTDPNSQSFSCRTETNPCTSAPFSSNTEKNYMSYTSCFTLFTNGQKERMHASMSFESRETLVRQGNLALIPPLPELTIISPILSQNIILAGGSLIASFAENNSGALAAQANYVNIHLSPDPILTPGLNGDIYLDQFFVNQELSPLSQTILLNQSITIPNSTPPGTYFVFFAADGEGNVAECDNDNNFATAQLIVSGSNTVSQFTYRYWFDNSFSQSIANNLTTGNTFNLQGLFATSSLSPGLHYFHIHFKDSTNRWSSIVSSPIIKLNTAFPPGSSKYEYWFDNEYFLKETIYTQNSINFLLLDTTNLDTLPNGLHTLHIRFKPEGKHWSSIVSSLFYKTGVSPFGNTEYEYWLDNNYTGRSTISNTYTSNFILLDSIITIGVSNGLHTLHFRFRPDGKTWSSVTSSFFYKDQNSITGINNLAQYVYWFDSNWQNPQTITITGVQNLNWTLNTSVDSLSNGPHVLSQAFKDDKGQWSSIISTDFTKQPASTPSCLSSGRQFTAGIIAGGGTDYQWQLDNGTGFNDILNNAVYTGANTDTLELSNAPTSWYGYKFRCRVTNGATTFYGPMYTLKFVSTWTGTTDNAWENPANWSCNTIPDANTDVYVNAGSVRYPEVNSTTATCRSLNLQPGTSFEVKPGFTINITGKN